MGAALSERRSFRTTPSRGDESGQAHSSSVDRICAAQDGGCLAALGWLTSSNAASSNLIDALMAFGRLGPSAGRRTVRMATDARLAMSLHHRRTPRKLQTALQRTPTETS